MESTPLLRRALIAANLALFCTLLVAGCGSDEVKTVPVSGTVRLGKDSLKTGSIAFHPDTSKGNSSAAIPTGEISNGQYKLSTAGKDGAPIGWYTVTVNASAPINPNDEYSETKPLIHKKYLTPKDSPLSVEVKEGGGPYDFEVTK
jgi:hypothetical protein